MTKTTTICKAGDRHHRGVVMVVALVVLVVLAALVYRVTAKVSSSKHRQQYLIDYQQARYACDSGMKYALAMIEETELDLAKRSDVPDFSDLFLLSHDEKQELLVEWARRINEAQMIDSDDNPFRDFMGQDADTDSLMNSILKDIFNDPNRAGDPNEPDAEIEPVDPNELSIPGPYGVDWPYVNKPTVFDIGSADVTVEIADENAKLPLVWALSEDEEVARQTEDAIEIFCEYMQLAPEDIELIYFQLQNIADKKLFKPEMDPVVLSKQVTTKVPISSGRPSSRSKPKRYRSRTTTQKSKRDDIKHTTDFAKLLHSYMLDLESYSMPTENNEDGIESVMKYMGMWGSSKVNVNSAPRHVLEAAFSFGGKANKVAQEIIVQRRLKPFKNIEDMKKRVSGFNESIRKAEPYITTVSTFLSVKVTARSGNAVAVSVATIRKTEKKAETIAVMSY